MILASVESCAPSKPRWTRIIRILSRWSRSRWSLSRWSLSARGALSTQKGSSGHCHTAAHEVAHAPQRFSTCALRISTSFFSLRISFFASSSYWLEYDPFATGEPWDRSRGCRDRERRQEAGGRRQEAGGRRQEAGGRRQEAGGRRQEAGGRRQEAEDRHRPLPCCLACVAAHCRSVSPHASDVWKAVKFPFRLYPSGR